MPNNPTEVIFFFFLNSVCEVKRDENYLRSRNQIGCHGNRKLVLLLNFVIVCPGIGKNSQLSTYTQETFSSLYVCYLLIYNVVIIFCQLIFFFLAVYTFLQNFMNKSQVIRKRRVLVFFQNFKIGFFFQYKSKMECGFLQIDIFWNKKGYMLLINRFAGCVFLY